MKTTDIIFKTLGYGIILGGLALLIYYAIYPSESYNSSNYDYFTSNAEIADYQTEAAPSKTQKETIQNKDEEIHLEKETLKEDLETKFSSQQKPNSQQAKKSNNKADKIIGVWEVRNDYYMAMYELEKYQGKYIGKVHYYNDGKTEYTGKNAKKDYFLDGVTYENGMYKNGKMYLPDGSKYEVTFKLENNDELEAKMTIDDTPYAEIWKRKITQ